MAETRRSRSDWNRIKQIFHEVREAPPPERPDRLGMLCGDDQLLRAQVQALLDAEAEADAFLDSPTVDPANAAARAAASMAASGPLESPGSHIGPYKLLQRIGEGGFGVVYMAEQEEPIRRRVALKVIKPGMDTKQVIARFEAERQALAMLDHPNIAKVFDAGTTPTGRPYFVMELVRGIPITDYCDEERLTTRERLELFSQVCGAVHHAHENGIIHRDIKPSNVLVTLHDGTPVPKVIDFGVAKAIRQRLTESTLFTEYNQFIGTPEYMSPEQAAYAGLDVDRRSDVYSLGALLYELLTGTTPLDARTLRRAAQLEVLRMLKEEEPPKPSTRVHTMGRSSEPLARDRRTDPGALAKLLRGDLDWIVMKTLEKDRTRRYDSASDLAADIQRYFDQRPIVARPPSTAYRVRKLLRRRRGRFATAAVVALALLADVLYVGWQQGRMASSAGAADAAFGQRAELLLTSDDQPCSYQSLWPSPDASRVVALDYCGGGVFLHDLASGTRQLLTDRGYYWSALWSPEGDQLLLNSGPRFDSHSILDLESRKAEVPTALAGLSFFPASWSPDGEHIGGALTGADRNISSAIISLETGRTTVLAEGVRQGQETGTFSPDGRYVVFADVVNESEDLFVLDMQTKERWPLVSSPEDEGRALWSPDGETIIYGNESGMWALPVARGEAQAEPRLIMRDAVWPSAWTEHGYYYSVSNNITRLHQLEVDPASGRPSGRRETVTLPAGDLPNIRFAWAPDMTRTAVAGWTDGMIRVLNGGAVSSFSIGSDVLPSNLWWARDGREILFTAAARGRERSRKTVFALDAERGTIRELFPPVQGPSLVHVSPDGERMVWFREDPTVEGLRRFREMVISDLGKTDGRVLTRPNEHGLFQGRFGQPLFSPDGSRILFVRFSNQGPNGLFVIGADGSGERLLATAPLIRTAVWDPRGRMIAYQGWYPDEERSRLHVVSLEDGTTREIESFAELGAAVVQAWSPDGEWLGITERVGRWEFWVNRDVLGDGD